MNTGPSSLSSGDRRLRSGRQLGRRGPFRAADFLLWSWQKGTGSVFSKDTGPTECHSLTALSPPRGPTSQPCHRGGPDCSMLTEAVHYRVLYQSLPQVFVLTYLVLGSRCVCQGDAYGRSPDYAGSAFSAFPNGARVGPQQVPRHRQC